MISIENLDFSYGKKRVLSGLTLQLEEGRIHGIVGYNGSGKTTLLNAIYGVPKRCESIKYKQRPLNRSEVSCLETEAFFYPGITGRDYLKVFVPKGSAVDYDSLCRLLNVPVDGYIDAYSSGTRKKLSIIAVLLMNKEILLLDEPFNGLDMESVVILQVILKKLREKGRTIIVTSHIIESLTPVCDTISLLQEGKIARTYQPDEFGPLSDEVKNGIETKFEVALDEILWAL